MSVHIFNKFMLLSPLIKSNINSQQNLDVEINELVQNLYLATVYRSKGHFAVALNANKAKKNKKTCYFYSTSSIQKNVSNSLLLYAVVSVGSHYLTKGPYT